MVSRISRLRSISMKNYKLQVEIKIVPCDEPIMSEPEALPSGGFSFNISSEAAESIDECEQALLTVNAPALREALGSHLESISKKNG